jgi:hypothetical protein
MKSAKVQLKSMTPYSQGKHYVVEKLKKELPRDYEERTWRERLHVDEKGEVFIPLTALKNCISEVAKYLAIQIPGKGKNTYTKHFEAGLLVSNHVGLGINKKDVRGEWVFVPSDGKRGGSKRVDKCFPVIDKWEGIAEFVILDDTITRDVFEQHVKEAGRFIGLGRFRPRNNGYYGRFSAEIIEWNE